VPDNHSVGRPPAQGVTAQDRATQVATDVIRVITGSLREWVHEDLRVPRPVRREIEAMLREFEDHACQARGGDPPTN
jgi:uncharacterized protein (UPF0147 family)